MTQPETRVRWSVESRYPAGSFSLPAVDDRTVAEAHLADARASSPDAVHCLVREDITRTVVDPADHARGEAPVPGAAGELRDAAAKLRAAASTLRPGAGAALADLFESAARHADIYARLAAAEGCTTGDPHPDSHIRHVLAAARAMNPGDASTPAVE